MTYNYSDQLFYVLYFFHTQVISNLMKVDVDFL